MRIEKIDYKLSLYAIDLLLYVTSPHTSFLLIIRVFKTFGVVSNFKVNYDKSELLNVSLPSQTVFLLSSNIPFHWQPVALKYLGIFLCTDLKTVIAHNYDPLLPTVCKLLDFYDKPMLSWLGRINMIKTDILSEEAKAYLS